VQNRKLLAGLNLTKQEKERAKKISFFIFLLNNLAVTLFFYYLCVINKTLS